jgi:hypothetical protein
VNNTLAGIRSNLTDGNYGFAAGEALLLACIFTVIGPASLAEQATELVQEIAQGDYSEASSLASTMMGSLTGMPSSISDTQWQAIAYSLDKCINELLNSDDYSSTQKANVLSGVLYLLTDSSISASFVPFEPQGCTWWDNWLDDLSTLQGEVQKGESTSATFEEMSAEVTPDNPATVAWYGALTKVYTGLEGGASAAQIAADCLVLSILQQIAGWGGNSSLSSALRSAESSLTQYLETGEEQYLNAAISDLQKILTTTGELASPPELTTSEWASVTQIINKMIEQYLWIGQSEALSNSVYLADQSVTSQEFLQAGIEALYALMSALEQCGALPPTMTQPPEGGGDSWVEALGALNTAAQAGTLTYAAAFAGLEEMQAACGLAPENAAQTMGRLQTAANDLLKIALNPHGGLSATQQVVLVAIVDLMTTIAIVSGNTSVASSMQEVQAAVVSGDYSTAYSTLSSLNVSVVNLTNGEWSVVMASVTTQIFAWTVIAGQSGDPSVLTQVAAIASLLLAQCMNEMKAANAGWGSAFQTWCNDVASGASSAVLLKDAQALMSVMQPPSSATAQQTWDASLYALVNSVHTTLSFLPYLSGSLETTAALFVESVVGVLQAIANTYGNTTFSQFIYQLSMDVKMGDWTQAFTDSSPGASGVAEVPPPKNALQITNILYGIDTAVLGPALSSNSGNSQQQMATVVLSTALVISLLLGQMQAFNNAEINAWLSAFQTLAEDAAQGASTATLQSDMTALVKTLE